MLEIKPLKNDLFLLSLEKEEKAFIIKGILYVVDKEEKKQNQDAEALLNWKKALQKLQKNSDLLIEFNYDEIDYLHQALYFFKDSSLNQLEQKQAHDLFLQLDTYFPQEKE